MWESLGVFGCSGRAASEKETVGNSGLYMTLWTIF